MSLPTWQNPTQKKDVHFSRLIKRYVYLCRCIMRWFSVVMATTQLKIKLSSYKENNQEVFFFLFVILSKTEESLNLKKCQLATVMRVPMNRILGIIEDKLSHIFCFNFVFAFDYEKRRGRGVRGGGGVREDIAPLMEKC